MTFPVCDLDLSPFVTQSVRTQEKKTLYDLCAFVSHQGSTADSNIFLLLFFVTRQFVERNSA